MTTLLREVFKPRKATHSELEPAVLLSRVNAVEHIIQVYVLFLILTLSAPRPQDPIEMWCNRNKFESGVHL
jgi:hypothetical protein